MWAPSIPTSLERCVFQSAFAIAYAENECAETTFPANNPVNGLQELVVNNPMTPINAGSFWSQVEVGDTVRVRYLTDDKRIIKITISNSQSDASHGIVHHRTPIASALLGAEAGDEVEILVGSYIRPAIIEDISKSNGGRAP
jgi:hypothetical protein